MTVQPNFPGPCAWCGEPATDRVHVRGRGTRRVYSLACPEHARRFMPPVQQPKRRREPEVEQRTPPLCQSCFAEVTFVTLVKGGRRMPVNRRALGKGAEIKRSMVVVNPAKSTAVVLTQAQVDSGEAKRWVAAGARLHLPHFATCESARRHRQQKAAAKAA